MASPPGTQNTLTKKGAQEIDNFDWVINTPGRYAKKNEFPFVVGIGFLFLPYHICGGALVKSKMALTSAYCVVRIKNGLRPLPDEIYVSDSIYTNENLNQVSDVKLLSGARYSDKVIVEDIAFVFLKKPKEIDFPKIGHGSSRCAIFGWNLIPTSYELPLKSSISKDKLLYTLQLLKVQKIENSNCQKTICQKEKSFCKLNLDDLNYFCTSVSGIWGNCSSAFGSPLICGDRLTAIVVSVSAGQSYCEGTRIFVHRQLQDISTENSLFSVSKGRTFSNFLCLISALDIFFKGLK